MNEWQTREATLSGVALRAQRSKRNQRLSAPSRWYLRRTLRVLTFLSLAFSASRSFAAEETQTYRDALHRALAAKDKALDSGTVENWVDTLRLLRAADAIEAVAVTKYEIALAAAQLGQTDIAVENYQAGLQLGLPEKACVRARDFVASHVSQLAQLQIEGPSGTQILLRGEERARLPLSRFVYVTPGSVALEAVLPDGRHVQRTLLLNAGHISGIVVAPDDSKSSTAISNNAAAAESAPASAAGNHHSRSFALATAPVTSDDSILSQATTAARGRGSVLSRPGWALVASGATAAILSGAFIPITYSRLSTSRDALRNACDLQTNGSDGCDHSKPDRHEEAQSASNSIATWKMARTVSWAGLFTGLAVTLGGSALLLSAHPKTETTLPSVLISAGPRQLQLSYTATLW